MWGGHPITCLLHWRCCCSSLSCDSKESFFPSYMPGPKECWNRRTENEVNPINLAWDVSNIKKYVPLNSCGRYWWAIYTKEADEPKWDNSSLETIVNTWWVIFLSEAWFCALGCKCYWTSSSYITALMTALHFVNSVSVLSLNLRNVAFPCIFS
jgi:hypothetical protein